MNHIIYQGHVLEVLKQMESESVNCIICSPPYFGLRKYTNTETIWDGDVNCEHQWGNQIFKIDRHKKGKTNPGKEAWFKEQGAINQEAGQICSKCGAWNGQLGNEPSVELYIEHLIQIFQEIKRVMRKDGTLWVNIADSYGGSGYGSGGGHQNLGGKYDYNYLKNPPQKNIANIKAKSLIGVPERFMLAMIDEGFILRNKIIWTKQILLTDNTTIGSCMPCSVKDRVNQSSWEYLYFFTKSPKYYFNLDAIRAKLVKFPFQMDYRKELWKSRGLDVSYTFSKEKRKTKIPEEQAETFSSPTARQYRKDTKQIILKYGYDPDGICPKCDRSWKSHVSPNAKDREEGIRREFTPCVKLGPKDFDTEWEYRCYIRQNKQYGGKGLLQNQHTFTGHYNPVKAGCPPDGVVMDIFSGVATTGIVAVQLNRQYIGIEISPEYCEMAKQRIEKKVGNLFDKVEIIKVKEIIGEKD